MRLGDQATLAVAGRPPSRAQAGRASEALSFAAHAHGSQRYGDAPYSVHLEATMRAVAELGFRSDVHQVVAALHDVLEDTPVTQAELAKRFGADAAAAVRQLTRTKGTLNAAYFGAMGPLAFAVKLADRLSNLRRHGHGSAAERERQRSHLLPKYRAEQQALTARARALGPELLRAACAVGAELDAATRRLSLAA